jgi:hypothetical protein
MRLTGCVATAVIGLSVICVSGCADKQKTTSQETSVTLTVDMPRVQTLQFLKQSASTLKLGDIRNENDDTIVAGASKAVASGPAAGPVTVILSGNENSVSQWSTMITDKLPAKKL